MQAVDSRFSTASRVLILRQMLWGAAFYGVFVLLTRFFLEELNYSEAETIMMLGAFGAVGPVFSAVGGFAADRFIGSFRAVYIGYTTYVIGFFLLGIGGTTLSVPLSLFAIALISYSRGLSATSPTVLLGNSFPDDKREVFQQALTINYSINNLGSFTARYLFPFFIAFHGYRGNFFISSGLMLITVILFFVFRKQLVETGNKLDRRPVSLTIWLAFIGISAVMLGTVYWVFSNLETGKYLLYWLGAGAIGYFIFEISRATRAYQWKMCAVLVAMFILIVFYFYYGQMNTSMNLYAVNMMNDQLFGFIPFKPESNSAFNPMWCFLMGAPVMLAYEWLEKKGFSPSIPTKFAMAFAFSATAFTLLGMSTGFIGDNGKIAAEWILSVHFFQAIAELVVGALGAGFIFEMVPRHLSAFAVGLRSVAISLSGILAAVISTRIALPRDQVLTPDLVQSVYADYFFGLGMMAAVMVVITLLLSRVIGKMVARGNAIEEENKALEPAMA